GHQAMKRIDGDAALRGPLFIAPEDKTSAALRRAVDHLQNRPVAEHRRDRGDGLGLALLVFVGLFTHRGFRRLSAGYRLKAGWKKRSSIFHFSSRERR